ncbi:fimbrial protein [Oceanisphaera marina]|uniref:Fimbrial protein n=1 Tax=Oceanisphaera marina TaxID=2017550 RepID=A0ABQ1IRT9_9GAMM|nr:PilN domain-containing protein [Oceanisphaera marina]GGB50934.1 fimbrial protein [Oceanisphaera marina]
MSNINLLPWREHLQATQKKRFIRQVGLICGLTLLVITGIHGFIKLQYHTQQQRNLQLKQASAQLDQTLLSIERVRRQRSHLQARINLIEEVQHRRPLIVKLFNQLPAWVPSDVYLHHLHLAEQNLNIKGQATAYESLALMVQQIEHSGWLMQPQLQAMAVTDPSLPPTSQFSLQLTLRERAGLLTPARLQREEGKP